MRSSSWQWYRLSGAREELGKRLDLWRPPVKASEQSDNGHRTDCLLDVCAHGDQAIGAIAQTEQRIRSAGETAFACYKRQHKRAVRLMMRWDDRVGLP
ncbi:hypothetical protein GQ44DRAFT_382495 [Phaeosphaeriaceae sp. PMI808]|nr:hypothetical protein GQ44DRAFT_382495 [Phaeosphaeriaceae sp. PMI808]